MGFWEDVFTAAIGSAAGACAGGVLAYWGGLRVATQTIQAQRDEDEARWDRERTAEQERRTQDAAAALLGPLAQAQSGVPFMAIAKRPGPAGIGVEETAASAIRALTDAKFSVLPLIADQEFRERFTTLITLTNRLTYASGTPVSKNRDSGDVDAYLRYVHLSVVALVHGTPMPVHVEPPNDLRESMDTWQPDPVPDGWLTA